MLRALVEGKSLRSTSRITGAALATVTGILRSVGYACRQYQNEVLVDLSVKRIQCDDLVLRAVQGQAGGDCEGHDEGKGGLAG